MTDTITYASSTPRLALPLLFAGQSQKETTVNEAILLADFLLAPVVEGTLGAPPAAPAPGKAWIIATAPSGDFAGRAGQLAIWTEGGWRFIAPVAGMAVEDRQRNARARFDSTWQYAVAPAAPTGGGVVDAQARSAISAVVSLLVSAGIFSAA